MIGNIKFLPILLLLVIVSCFQQKPQHIASYFEEMVSNKKFNGNALIVKNDTIIYRNSFGYAKGDKSEYLTEEHLFQIGSIYKEFPAVTIMQLKEKGLLSLDDNLSLFIQDLPGWSSKITIRHLLQYSSGLPLIDWPTLFQGEERISLELVLSQLPTIEELDFQPGSNYLYSNYNPFLLIQIVESISALGFEQYLEQNIFSPYNIKGIVVANRYPYIDTIDQNFAYPFNENMVDDDLEYELPSLCASIEGIYKWFNLLDNFQIVSRGSILQLSKEAKKGDNIQSPLGRADWENGKLQLHLHHGSSGNYECLVRNYKQEGIHITLLTNQKHRNLHDIADNVYEMLSK